MKNKIENSQRIYLPISTSEIALQRTIENQIKNESYSSRFMIRHISVQKQLAKLKKNNATRVGQIQNNQFKIETSNYATRQDSQNVTKNYFNFPNSKYLAKRKSQDLVESCNFQVSPIQQFNGRFSPQKSLRSTQKFPILVIDSDQNIRIQNGNSQNLDGIISNQHLKSGFEIYIKKIQKNNSNFSGDAPQQQQQINSIKNKKGSLNSLNKQHLQKQNISKKKLNQQLKHYQKNQGQQCSQSLSRTTLLKAGFETNQNSSKMLHIVDEQILYQQFPQSKIKQQSSRKKEYNNVSDSFHIERLNRIRSSTLSPNQISNENYKRNQGTQMLLNVHSKSKSFENEKFIGSTDARQNEQIINLADQQFYEEKLEYKRLNQSSRQLSREQIYKNKVKQELQQDLQQIFSTFEDEILSKNNDLLVVPIPQQDGSQQIQVINYGLSPDDQQANNDMLDLLSLTPNQIDLTQLSKGNQIDFEKRKSISKPFHKTTIIKQVLQDSPSSVNAQNQTFSEKPWDPFAKKQSVIQYNNIKGKNYKNYFRVTNENKGGFVQKSKKIVVKGDKMIDSQSKTGRMYYHNNDISYRQLQDINMNSTWVQFNLQQQYSNFEQNQELKNQKPAGFQIDIKDKIQNYDIAQILQIPQQNKNQQSQRGISVAGQLMMINESMLNQTHFGKNKNSDKGKSMYIMQDERWNTQRNIFMKNQSGMSIVKANGHISEELSGSYFNQKSSRGREDQEQSMITRQQANASPWSSKEQHDKIGDLRSQNLSPLDRIKPSFNEINGIRSQNSVFQNQQEYGFKQYKLPYQIQSSKNISQDQQNNSQIHGILKTKHYVNPQLLQGKNKQGSQEKIKNLSDTMHSKFNSQQSEVKKITLNLQIQAAQISPKLKNNNTYSNNSLTEQMSQKLLQKHAFSNNASKNRIFQQDKSELTKHQDDIQQHILKAKQFKQNSLILPATSTVTQLIFRKQLDAAEEAKSNAEEESTAGMPLQSQPQSPKFISGRNQSQQDNLMKQLGVHNKFQFSKSDLLHLSNSQEKKIQLQSAKKLAFITVDTVQKKQKQVKTVKNNKRIILPASKINLTLTQQQIISPQIQYGKKNLIIPHKTLNEIMFTNQQSVQQINNVDKIITCDIDHRIQINSIENNLHKQNSGQIFSSLESKDSKEQIKEKLPFSNYNVKSTMENNDIKQIQSNQFSLIDNNNDIFEKPLNIAQINEDNFPKNFQNAHSNLTIMNIKYKKKSFQIQKDQNGRQDSKSAQSNMQGQQSANTNVRDISNNKELPSQIMHSLPRSSFLMSEQLNQQQQFQSQINNQTFFVDKDLQMISSLQQNDKQQDISDSIIENNRDSKLKIQKLQEKQKNINEKYFSSQYGVQSQLENHRIMLGNFKKKQMQQKDQIQDLNKIQNNTLQEFNPNLMHNNHDLKQDFNINQDNQFSKTGKIDLSNDQNKKNYFLNLNQQMNITNALKLENSDQKLIEKLKIRKKSYIPAISIESDLENILVNQNNYQQQLTTFQSRRRTMNDSKTIYNTSKNQNDQQKFIFPSLTGKQINQETLNFSSPKQSSFNQHNQSIFMKSTLNNSVLNDRKFFKNTKAKIEIDNHNERMKFIRQKNSLNFLVKEKEQIYDFKNTLNQTIQDRISIIDQIKQQEKLIDIISKYFK